MPEPNNSSIPDAPMPPDGSRSEPQNGAVPKSVPMPPAANRTQIDRPVSLPAPPLGQPRKISRAARRRQRTLLILTPIVLLLGLSLTSLLFQESEPADSISTVPTNEEVLDTDALLAQADRLVQQDKLRDALRIIANVPEASTKRDEIIAELLQRARNMYPDNLELAVYILGQIPGNSSQYSQAQELKIDWEKQLYQLEAAEFALGQKNLSEAQRQIDLLKETPIRETERYQSIEATLKERSNKSSSQEEDEA